MTGRVLIITKCADCPKTDCPLRTPCGGIPEDCPLPRSINKDNNKRYILKGDNHGN
jgi:hypothetical protein